MSTIKTAVSIPESLFQQINLAAKKMKISRSKVFVKAVTDFLKNWKNEEMLEQLNSVHEEFSNAQEQKKLVLAKKKYRKFVEGEW